MTKEANGSAALGRSMAGPVFRGGEIAQAALEAIREDNPRKEIVVEDHGTYVRIEAEGGLVIRRQTLESIMGRPVDLQEVQGSLSSFSGKIDTRDDEIHWYFKLT